MAKSRRWVYRLVAAGIPALLGLAVMVWVLFQRGWVSVDKDTGRIVLQRPPLYLQEPGHEVTGHRYLYDVTLGWRNIPGWKATTRGRPLTINTKGLRDRDYPSEKPAGVKRILVLGDSYTWGYGVADTEVFTEVLEERLASGLTRWEVINAGVSGWGTDQQYLFFKQEGIQYDPDVVVVAFFIGNDIDNNFASQQYGLHKPVFIDYELTLGNVPVPRPTQRVDGALQSRVDRLEPIRLTTSILQGISDACAERDCQLVLMKFGIFLAPELPYAINLERGFVQAKDQAALQLSYLDLDRAFRERKLDTPSLLEGNDDGHWNAYGHKQVAILLQEFLQQQDLLK